MYSTKSFVFAAASFSVCRLSSRLYALDSSIPSEEFDAETDIPVAIQWHISPFVGFVRDVASGSVRTRVLVLLPASVRVGDRDAGAEESEWIFTMGGAEVSEGGMMLPRETVWWPERYERESENEGEKSSRTGGVS